MKNSKAILILPLILVLISGCIQFGGPATGGYGVEITRFGGYYEEVESGDQFDLMVDVKNTGGTTARNVKAFLHGISSSEWQFRGAKEVSRELKGPDEEMGIEGETDFAKWTLTAPQLIEGVRYTYTPRVRVFYKYSTLASTSVPALSESEYKRMVSKDLELPRQGTTSVSKGPLGVEVNTRSPIIVRRGGEEFRVVIKVSNLIPKGSTFNPNYIHAAPNIPERAMNEFRIKISAPDVSPRKCNAFRGWDTIELRRGDEATYNCELFIPTHQVKTRKDIPVHVELDYGYLIDDKTSITVVGTGQRGGFFW